jgi:YD repeat-containing protein
VLKTISPLAEAETYGYDGMDHVTTVKDANGYTTTYKYNWNSNLAKNHLRKWTRHYLGLETDPPYAVGYTGGSHPQSWGNKGAANRDKDWSGQYVEATNADVKNTEQSGLELYRGFIDTAINYAITPSAAWYCFHASRRQAVLESIWNEFGAFVHQQIIWMKSRPVLTYSTYLWQHDPCLFGWIKGEKPRTYRSEVGQRAGEFPTTVWAVPSSEIETDAHPTCKPTKLFALPIEMHTERGEICYEPFSGSGSQLVAAQQLGRHCFAIEKSPPFVAVALERLSMMGLKPQLIDS